MYGRNGHPGCYEHQLLHFFMAPKVTVPHARHSLRKTPSRFALRTSFRKSPHLRYYQSSDHGPSGPFTNAQTAILSAALAHVPSYGFTTNAIELGAADVGLPAASKGTLTRGTFDLVHYHLLMRRLALKPFAAKMDMWLETRAKLRTLLLERLVANRPVIRHWQQVRPCSTDRDGCAP